MYACNVRVRVHVCVCVRACLRDGTHRRAGRNACMQTSKRAAVPHALQEWCAGRQGTVQQAVCVQTGPRPGPRSERSRLYAHTDRHVCSGCVCKQGPCDQTTGDDRRTGARNGLVRVHEHVDRQAHVDQQACEELHAHLERQAWHLCGCPCICAFARAFVQLPGRLRDTDPV